MKITSFGAAQTTTGSKHLLEINDQKILLDCGMFQGKREESYEKNKHLPFDPSKLNAVILSHAHIDHSGILPVLGMRGFKGNIYSTFATRDLCNIMLADSAKVQAQDLAYVNKKREKKNLDPFHPIYSQKEVEAIMGHFVAIDYNRPMIVADGITATFIDAGHILGSAQVILDYKENGVKKRFLFSGDVGRGQHEILRDPVPSEDVDSVLIESTYGGRQHEDIKSLKKDLCRIVNETIEKRGKLLIPSFAVGRVQQVVYMLHQLREVDCFPKIPIYVDSPLAVNATEVFRLHPECYNQDIHDFLLSKKNPFGWDEIHFIREVSQSMELNKIHEPIIIISASGMCEAGRILHHLANNIEDERNTVLFVGHCAENTLGAKILSGEKKVNIFGEPHHVKIKVERLEAFSGHADHDELLAYTRRISGKKSRFMIVHGEPEYCSAFQKGLQEEYPQSLVTINENGVPVEVS